ncbi:Segregation and condensation protein A [Tepidanaerobacter acetatoxydans Re1]|uniref:Segregation and condensation protein A n=1 Tax=Tepidanaerobacter acetatoxydans (strain DSM 21804 / JCM 16047 / Re1) TaxID=1209989 RepID=F4LUY4_TEPAE|nr:segregation/condensation protein A [Tepidanaerobacter acetatoxydans]AEE91510.1 Segregation and condensation protein A [Tepidanaerobacter acetatoxydans Re1]CCP26224.1 Segregation and condensation protein A [Tepidanaerobacter acetatoxydans Re1]
MTLNIKIDAFEGPFDLLFHLIEKNQIDIYDIPIADLTEQYLSFIEEIRENKLDLASEFLVMAATLLSIKSKLLLPSNQNQEVQSELAAMEDDDPRDDLVNKLLEYKKFKEISLALKAKEEEQKLILKKPPEDLSYVWATDFSISKISLEDLKSSFISVMNKKKPEEKISKITKDSMPLSHKITEVYKTLKRLKSQVRFSKLFSYDASKTEIIMTFLAILELIKMNRILAAQEKQFGEIVLTCREA